MERRVRVSQGDAELALDEIIAVYEKGATEGETGLARCAALAAKMVTIARDARKGTARGSGRGGNEDRPEETASERSDETDHGQYADSSD